MTGVREAQIIMESMSYLFHSRWVFEAVRGDLGLTISEDYNVVAMSLQNLSEAP